MPGFVDPKLANIVAELNRSAPSGAHAPEPVADTSSLDRLLAQAARQSGTKVVPVNVHGMGGESTYRGYIMNIVDAVVMSLS